MKPQTKKILIGLGVAALAGGAIYYFTRPAAAAALPAGTTPAAPATTSSSTSTTATNGRPELSAPSSSTVPSGIPANAAAAGLSASQWQTLDAWAQTLGSGNYAQWQRMENSFTVADWQGLADLYFNAWVGGQGGSPARTTFWDTWRTTYHIDDGTY